MSVLAVVSQKVVDRDNVIALMNEQNARRKALDPRLPVPSEEEIRNDLDDALRRSPLITVHRGESLVGMAVPDLVVHDRESEAPTYWPDRMGTFAALALGPGESGEVLSVLVAEADQVWRAARATGVGILWPSIEDGVDAVLAEHEVVLDARFCFRRLAGARSSTSRTLPRVTVRRARPGDEESVVRLYLDVIDAHIPHSPFARRTSAAEPAFRQRLARLWRGEGLGSGAPGVLVAEVDGVVSAMAEYWSSVPDSHLAELLPPGCHAYVDSFGVAPALRVRGVGTTLAAAMFEEFTRLGFDGTCLWFSVYNRSASSFWPKLGYTPLWTSYQRRYLPEPC